MAIDPNNLPNLQNLQGDPGYSNPDVYQFAGDAENFATSQTTTLPFWYNVAGQNLANLAYAQTPESLTQAGQASQNVGQAAAQNQTNITGTQNTLQNIASGLANPYTTSGQLDTSTVPGKLFQSQFDLLNEQLPEITAGQDATAIAQGGFGGLRNQVASNVARGQAIADLGQRQAQSLLQGQQTGINALQQSGSLGQQNLAGQIAAGQFNVQAPFSPLTNYANVLGQIAQGAPQTTYNSPSYVDIDAAKAQAQAVQRANSIFAKQGGRIGGLNHVPKYGLGGIVKGLIGLGKRKADDELIDVPNYGVVDSNVKPSIMDIGDLEERMEINKLIREQAEADAKELMDRAAIGSKKKSKLGTAAKIGGVGAALYGLGEYRRSLLPEGQKRTFGQTISSNYNEGGLAHFAEGGRNWDVNAAPEFTYEEIMDSLKTVGDDFAPEDQAEVRATLNQYLSDYYLPKAKPLEAKPSPSDMTAIEQAQGLLQRPTTPNAYNAPTDRGIGDYASWDTFYDDLNSVKRELPSLAKAYDERQKNRTVLGDFAGGLGVIGDKVNNAAKYIADPFIKAPQYIRNAAKNSFGGLPLYADGGSIEDEIEANIMASGNQPYYDPRMIDYLGNDVDGSMPMDERMSLEEMEMLMDKMIEEGDL